MKKLVLFDFDGVIVDSLEISYKLSNQITYERDKETYLDLFMGNIYETVERGVEDGKADAQHAEWFKRYNPQLLKLPIVNGMPEVIKALSKKYTLVVISSTITSPIKEYLKNYNLTHFFDMVYGGDVHKSKREKIDMMLKQYNALPSDCIFITDTVGDLIEAKEKQIPSFVVTWGFHNKERFSNHPPAGFIEKPDRLVQTVDNFFI